MGSARIHRALIVLAFMAGCSDAGPGVAQPPPGPPSAEPPAPAKPAVKSNTETYESNAAAKSG